MIKAKIRIGADSLLVSRSILNCLKPDNKGLRGLKVLSRATPKNAYLTLSYDGRVETFISSLDDLLRCIQAAKATLNTITRAR